MNRLRVVVVTLLALGMAVSTYLLWRHMVLIGGTSYGTIDVCQTAFGGGCDATLSSSLSIQLGIPLAGWGVVYYVSLVILLGLGWTQGETFETEATVGATFVAMIGAVASVVLTATMLSGSVPLCIACMAVHIINFALVLALKAQSQKTLFGLLGSIKAGTVYLFGGKTADPIASGWKLCGFITAALVGVVVYQFILIQTSHHAFEAKRLVAEFQATDIDDIPITDVDPIRGPANAKVTMIVFSSFQCPGCQVFTEYTNELIANFNKDVRVVFKHFPISTSCNPDAIIDAHPEGCQIAYAAVAASRQGEFWHFHDELFAHGKVESKKMITHIAEHCDIDIDQFNRDIDEANTIARVKRDIELGIRLGVKATPTVFLNGRRVRELSPEILDTLIRHELDSTN